MAAKNRGRNQVKVRLDGYTPNSQERRESRNLGEAGAPLRPAPRKTRRKYRSHGSDMTRLVTAVKNAYLSRQSLSEPKNTNIPVQLFPYIPFQHRTSPTARSTPATGLLKLGNRGPREHTRLRTLRVLEKQPKSCPITARCPGKISKNK